MDPVETLGGASNIASMVASNTASMVSDPSYSSAEILEILSSLEPERAIRIFETALANVLANFVPDEMRMVERDLAAQRRVAESAAAMERSLAAGERMLALKENLAACKRVAEANPENDPERIQELWLQDRRWCRRGGIDFYDAQTRDLFFTALCFMLDRARGNMEDSSYLNFSEGMLHLMIVESNTLAHLRLITFEILTNFRDKSSGHLLIASCHVTRGPDAKLASWSRVAA